MILIIHKLIKEALAVIIQGMGSASERRYVTLFVTGWPHNYSDPW